MGWDHWPEPQGNSHSLQVTPREWPKAAGSGPQQAGEPTQDVSLFSRSVRTLQNQRSRPKPPLSTTRLTPDREIFPLAGGDLSPRSKQSAELFCADRTRENACSLRRDRGTITSPKHTLVSCLFRLFTLFSAFLVLSTGTLIMGVLMLALATMRISLSLSQNKGTSDHRGHPDSPSVRPLLSELSGIL